MVQLYWLLTARNHETPALEAELSGELTEDSRS